MKAAFVSILLMTTACGGLAGAQGEQGEQGEQGPAGENGKDGNSIVGPRGSTGATGATGAAGQDGAPGAPGAAGQTGATGATGATGQTGATGAPGQNGRNAAGFVWVDSNNQAMPFFQVTDANQTVFGISGYVVDPNTGYTWAFTYGQNGFSATAAEPNGTYAPSLTYYTTNNCSGTGYYPWSYEKGVTTSLNGGSTVYVGAVQPSILTTLSYKDTSGNCFVQTNATIPYVATTQLLTNPRAPKSMGVAPYSLTWQD